MFINYDNSTISINYNIKDEKVKTNIPLEAIIYDCF